jgi:hypothetical protein
MGNIQTSQALLERLRTSAKRTQSQAEIDRQRVSFVLGTLKDKSTVTRSRVEEILAKQDGRKSA